MQNNIIVRQRFPNFVCDGLPYGPDEKMYRYELATPEEFFDLEWVQEKMSYWGVVSWYISKSKSWPDDTSLIMGKEANGTEWAYGWLIEGEMFLPVEWVWED